MADGVTILDATATAVEILTDQVTDGTLGTGQKQIVGIMDSTVNSTNKLLVGANGAAGVMAAVDGLVAAGVLVVPLQAFANVSASTTDGVVVAAVSSKKILVLAAAFVVGATATTAVFNSKPSGGGSAISPSFANGVNSGAVLPFNQCGWFVTNTGEGLSLTTGSGSSTGVLVTYVTV